MTRNMLHRIRGVIENVSDFFRVFPLGEVIAFVIFTTLVIGFTIFGAVIIADIIK